MDFRFPYSTCEKVDEYGVQPVSAAINGVSMIVLLYFFLVTKSPSIRRVLFLFLLFEAVHTFSHLRHIPGNVQLCMIHVLGYCILFSMLWMFWKKTGHCLPAWQMMVWSALLLVDASLFLGGAPFLAFLTTSATLFTLLFVFYAFSLPPTARALLPWMVLVIAATVLADLAEGQYCQQWMAKKVLPYHALVEMLGLLVFVLLGLFLQRLDGK